jgi:hypothetical protein
MRRKVKTLILAIFILLAAVGTPLGAKQAEACCLPPCGAC